MNPLDVVIDGESYDAPEILIALVLIASFVYLLILIINSFPRR